MKLAGLIQVNVVQVSIAKFMVIMENVFILAQYLGLLQHLLYQLLVQFVLACVMQLIHPLVYLDTHAVMTHSHQEIPLVQVAVVKMNARIHMGIQAAYI
jgi:hypothetical protein